MFNVSTIKIPSSQAVSVCFDVLCRNLFDRFPLLRQEPDFELFDNGMSDLVLNCKNVGEIAIKALGPNVTAFLAINQLPSYAYACACFAHTAFQHEINAQLTADLLDL